MFFSITVSTQSLFVSYMYVQYFYINIKSNIYVMTAMQKNYRVRWETNSLQ